MEHPAPIDSLPEAARKVLRGPPPMKMMAARGMAPLPPSAMVSVLYALAYDADEKLATAAKATLDKLPAPLLEGALGVADLPAPVLDELALRLGRARPEILDQIVQHGATAGETVARIAATANEALTELIATNEQRLIAHPAIIEALYMNRATRMSTADRIVELAARNGVELSIHGFKEIVASLQNELIPEPGEVTPADEMFRVAIDEAEIAERDVADDEDVVDRDEEGGEALKKKFEEVQTNIGKMKISELMRCAMIGTMSQRMILVRHHNRLVAMAAIKSPKAQANDAERIVQSAAVGDDVLREIGKRRDWLGQRPTIRGALCKNPKTPLHVSIAQLPFLRETDLKALARSRNIPQSLKSTVNQILSKRKPGGA